MTRCRFPVIRRRFWNCLLLLAVSVPAAAFDLNGWTWKRPIENQGATGYVGLNITPDVFDQSQPSLNDLRILDKNGGLVPFIINWERTASREKREARSLQMINATFEAGKFSRVTLDFGESVQKSQLQVSLSGDNYRRAALIEGSTDTLAWESIAEKQWLFDVSLPDRRYKFDTLNFPVNNFRYLRLTVENMPDDPRRITIENVSAQFVVTTPGRLEPIEAKLTATHVDSFRGDSIYEFDLGYRNLPVAAVEFGVENPWFHRAYDLSGRNSTTETLSVRAESGTQQRERESPWQGIRGGVLYRIGDPEKVKESVKIGGLDAPYRYLQLRIHNGDDRALKLTTATAFLGSAQLAFDYETGEEYTLAGGNSSAGAPSFDLATAKPKLQAGVGPRVTLGAIQWLNDSQPQAPWTERNAGILWTGLIVAAGAMLFLVLKNLKQTGSQ
ncbi:MAG: DUF3999 domain-containing protein [Candidatus Sumerlaeaceae bacterium]|nr:DUF3999 domain-containing protein [Candidatus Sumerlaeaceae bacterium]